MDWTPAAYAMMVSDEDRINVICGLIYLEHNRSGKTLESIILMVTNVLTVIEEDDKREGN